MNGYCPAILRTIEQVAGSNAPSAKLHNAGFLAMLNCCQNSSVNPINDGADDNGHVRPITVSYSQRPTLDDVQDEDNCDINRIPTELEWNVPGYHFASSSFYMSNEQLAQYCEEASRTVSIGSPVTRIAQKHFDKFRETANIVMKKMNLDLVTDMATLFGDNATTGSTSKAININSNGSSLILDNGIVEMMGDFRDNEICGDVCLVGGGLYANYDMHRAALCCNAAGVDASRVNTPTFYFDKDTQTIWGNNSVGAFAKGSVALLERNQYQRFFSGEMGDSVFFTAPLPISYFGCADPCQAVTFDVQLKAITCPTEVIGPNGTPITVSRGWLIIVSKQYALWVQPTNAYAAGDELEGTNGTLKYFFSNNSSTAPAYAYP